MSKTFKISGVGSLPHPHTDSALAFSFKHDLPFLPQLPLRSKKETMIYQGLDGIGDIEVTENGEVIIHSFFPSDQWNSEFSYDSYRCFKPFFYECEQREIFQAKVQLTGPYTLYQYSKIKEKNEEHFIIIQEFFLQKITWLMQNSALDELFLQIDEPALFMLDNQSWNNFFHSTMEQVNRIADGHTKIGIHCCSNCRWKELLNSNLHFLSFDFILSAESLIHEKEKLQQLEYILVGLFDTHPKNSIEDQSAEELTQKLYQWLEKADLIRQKIILTPACGLGHKKIAEAQEYLSKLKESSRLANKYLSCDFFPHW